MTLSLSAEEVAFRDKLERLPSPPERISREQIASVLGRDPDSVVDAPPQSARLQWNVIGPGVSPERGLVIQIYKDQLGSIMWLQPGSFFLYRGYAIP
jgi:hypothetical protein